MCCEWQIPRHLRKAPEICIHSILLNTLFNFVFVRFRRTAYLPVHRTDRYPDIHRMQWILPYHFYCLRCDDSIDTPESIFIGTVDRCFNVFGRCGWKFLSGSADRSFLSCAAESDFNIALTKCCTVSGSFRMVDCDTLSTDKRSLQDL